MTGAEILVKSLEDIGIKHIFGYTGSAILPVMDELGKSSIEIVVNSNEQSAAFSAAGYSRSSDSVGIVIVTSGPAITNTLTAVADSFADSIPLMVIAGQVPEHKIGTDSFQHIDVSAVFGPTSKKVILVDRIDDMESIIKDAYFLAKSGKPGPVVIDIPINLQQNTNKYSGNNISMYESVYKNEWHLSENQCKYFFDLLLEAKKPLLYLGGGLNSKAGSKAIRRFNSLFNIPSVNTLMAKGVVNENATESLGLLGMYGTPCANKIIQENDFFFAIGVRWDDRVAEKIGFAINAKIAYIDINPQKVYQIRNERQPEFSYIGDAAEALNDLTNHAIKKNIKININQWQKYAAQLKKRWPLNYKRNGNYIYQAEVLDKLNKIIDETHIITTGVGNHQLLAAQYLNMLKPKTFLTPGSFGTMGFGMPSAIGAYFANPESRIIVIDGDGSFRMNLGEMHTIASLNLPIKVLLLNNKSDGMVYNLENAVYGGRHSATKRKADIPFSELAEHSGYNFAKRISKRNELDNVLSEFINSGGPCILEIMTDIEEEIYPIVRAGCSYSEMDLGPYIKEVSN